MSNYTLQDNGDGTFSYSYVAIKEGTVTFKFIINDGDMEKEILVGPLQVGEGSTGDSDKDDTTKPGTSTGMSCNFGSFMILPLIAAVGILILRKREF